MTISILVEPSQVGFRADDGWTAGFVGGSGLGCGGC